MKILYINKFFFLKGGAEAVLFQEREFITNKGLSVMDFSMKDERNVNSHYEKFFIEKIEYNSPGGLFDKVKTGLSFIHSAEAVKKLEMLLKMEIPDIAHLHNIYHQLTPSIIPVLKRHGVKVAMTLHDYKLICPSYLALNKTKNCTACNGNAFWRVATRRCQGSRMREFLFMGEGLWHLWRKSYEAVDIFFVPSRFLADMTAARVQREKIHLLRNGINSHKYIPHYGDKGYALYFGRLSKEKGVKTLLEAHKGVKSDMPLKVVGTGPLTESLQTAYPDVVFLGYKKGVALHDLIREAAFVVVPSEWYENCSMVVLEAMAFGKAVIASSIGGIPEQVEDGKSGILFEPGNVQELGEKMSLLIKDKALRLEMGKAGRKILEKKFSLRDHCEKLLGFYERLMRQEAVNF